MKKLLSFVLVLAMVLACVSMAFATAEPFADAPNSAELTVLRDLGVVEGDNGKVNPERTITRAEVCALLMRLLGYESVCQTFTNVPSGFKDVKTGTWYNGYIALAYQLGLVDGVSATEFQPNGTVNYEQALAFIIKALGYREADLPLSWPYNFLVFAQATLHIVDGSMQLGTILTRAQMFSLLYGAMDTKTVTYNGTGYTEGKTFAELVSGKTGAKAAIGSGDYTTGRAVVTKSMADNAANATYGSVTVSKYVGKYCDLLYKNGQVMAVLGVVNGTAPTGQFTYNKLTGEIKYAGKSAGKTLNLADANAWMNFYINGDIAGLTSTEAIANVIEAIKISESDPEYAIDSAVVSVVYAKDGSIASFAAIDIWQRTAFGIVEESELPYYKNGSYSSVAALYAGSGLTFQKNGDKIVGLSIEGAASSLEKLQTGDVLTIYASIFGEITKIHSTRNVVVATYEGFYRKALDTYYSFDGKSYALSTVDNGQSNRSLNANGAFAIENSSTYVGSQYALYLNRDGEIEAYRNLYDGKIPVTHSTGYAVITKLVSTSETAMVGLIPVLKDMKNDIELYDLETGEKILIEGVSYEGYLGRTLVGKLTDNDVLASSWLYGWMIDHPNLKLPTYFAGASDAQYVVEYALDNGELSLSPASSYEYKSDLKLDKSGVTEGSKLYPYSSDCKVVCFVDGGNTEVKSLDWVKGLQSFDGYYHVSKYGFVDQIIVCSSTEVVDAGTTLKYVAVEAVAVTTKRYVTLYTGLDVDSYDVYELDASNPTIGEIYLNVKVIDGVAHMAYATNLKTAVAVASFAKDDVVYYYSNFAGYTNIFKGGLLRASTLDPEIWVYDAEHCEYNVFTGTVEAAQKEIKDSTGIMNLYDLDKDGLVEFIVVYPTR